MLRAKLFALQEEERLEKIATTRKMQVGTGSRSEKIRTYNYKDSRRARTACTACTACTAACVTHRVPYARTAGRAHGTHTPCASLPPGAPTTGLARTSRWTASCRARSSP